MSDGGRSPAATTPVGTVGRRLAEVDPAGGVLVAGAAWSLEWWVESGAARDGGRGAGSGRGQPRQRLVEGTPVVETAVRVAGGDVVHRTAGVVHAGCRAVIVEVDNRSPSPVAVALAIHGEPGSDRAPSVELDGEGRFVVAGRTAVVPERRPARVEARGHAAAVFPLPHRAGLRLALGGTLTGSATPPVHPRDLAGIDAAVRAWRRVLDGGVRLELPDGSLAAAVGANRGFLLLGPPDPRDPTARWARTLSDYGYSAGTVELRRTGMSLLRRRRRRRGAVGAPQRSDRLARLEALLAGASPTWTWPASDGSGDAGATVELLGLVRDVLVEEHPGDGRLRPTLALCSVLPPAWRGQPFEVHGAPTASGLLSFAVRWHGARPALMWDLDGQRSISPSITAPGLDPDWRTDERSGEVLLAGAPAAAPPSAGPAMPSVPSSPADRRGAP